MNQIQGAIRQHLFEILSPLYECKIGSSHKDCSYLDYSEALELRVKGELLLIVLGDGMTMVNGSDGMTMVNGSGARLIWSGGPMAYKDILGEAVVPDIDEPDFASFTRRIVDTLENFRMVAVHDDS